MVKGFQFIPQDKLETSVIDTTQDPDPLPPVASGIVESIQRERESTIASGTTFGDNGDGNGTFQQLNSLEEEEEQHEPSMLEEIINGGLDKIGELFGDSLSAIPGISDEDIEKYFNFDNARTFDQIHPNDRGDITLAGKILSFLKHAGMNLPAQLKEEFLEIVNDPAKAIILVGVMGVASVIPGAGLLAGLGTAGTSILSLGTLFNEINKAQTYDEVKALTEEGSLAMDAFSAVATGLLPIKKIVNAFSFGKAPDKLLRFINLLTRSKTLDTIIDRGEEFVESTGELAQTIAANTGVLGGVNRGGSGGRFTKDVAKRLASTPEVAPEQIEIIGEAVNAGAVFTGFSSSPIVSAPQPQGGEAGEQVSPESLARLNTLAPPKEDEEEEVADEDENTSTEMASAPTEVGQGGEQEGNGDDGILKQLLSTVTG